METLSTEQARKHLGELVRQAAADGTVTAISMHGIPAAAVVPLSMIREQEQDADGPR